MLMTKMFWDEKASWLKLGEGVVRSFHSSGKHAPDTAPIDMAQFWLKTTAIVLLQMVQQ